MQAASPARRKSPPPVLDPLTRELELVDRTPPDAVALAASRLLVEEPCLVRVLAAADDLHAVFAPPTEDCGLAALGADIAMLGRAYSACTGEPVVDVRLEAVRDDACRAFHRDNVRLRLITTYAGPGTEYVADADAGAALRLQSRFAGTVHACPTGALAWMRGAAAGPGRGLVHRSPPIASRGIARLVLVIGAPSATSPSRWTSMDGPVWEDGSAASKGYTVTR